MASSPTTDPRPPTEPGSEPKRSMTGLYLGALLVEVLVLALLWTIGATF